MPYHPHRPAPNLYLSTMRTKEKLADPVWTLKWQPQEIVFQVQTGRPVLGFRISIQSILIEGEI